MQEKPVGEDTPILVNLACGVKTHPEWYNVDMSPYALLRRNMWLARLLKMIGFISDERWDRIQQVDPHIIHWDIRRGIPFADNQVDVIYHSHFLEHLPRRAVPDFLRECRRALRRGGVMRIVVPDLQAIINRYQRAIRELTENDQDKEAIAQHEQVIFVLFDQMVRTEAEGQSKQKRWVAGIERWVRGGPGKIGELHRWMYDEFSLSRLLGEAGFTRIKKRAYNTSMIPNLSHYGLDEDDEGKERKPGSLYVEAVKIE